MRVGIRNVVIVGALGAAAPVFGGWDEGVAAFKAKNYAQAAREFETVAKDRPDWAGGFLMLGRTQLLVDLPGKLVGTLRRRRQCRHEPGGDQEQETAA